jgi:carbamoyltransferase
MLTGGPVLLDASFDVAGEPIVETAEGAIPAFTSMRLDYLAVGAACMK